MKYIFSSLVRILHPGINKCCEMVYFKSYGAVGVEKVFAILTVLYREGSLGSKHSFKYKQQTSLISALRLRELGNCVHLTNLQTAKNRSEISRASWSIRNPHEHKIMPDCVTANSCSVKRIQIIFFKSCCGWTPEVTAIPEKGNIRLGHCVHRICSTSSDFVSKP